MELCYRYATVSFCPDLADPGSPSLPVALLMIATSGERMIAAATGWYPHNDPDPITAALLKDMPRFLRAHVDEALSAQSDVDSETLLCALQHSLRNSVHVSAVSPEMVERVDETAPETLAGTVTSKAISLFFGQMRDAGLYLLDQAAKSSEAAERPSMPLVPPLAVWQLPKRADKSHSSMHTLS